MQTKVKRLLNLEAAQYNMDSAEAVQSEFIQGCSFNTADCVDSDWSVFNDPIMGRCFIFNNDSSRNASRYNKYLILERIFKNF